MMKKVELKDLEPLADEMLLYVKGGQGTPPPDDDDDDEDDEPKESNPR